MKTQTYLAICSFLLPSIIPLVVPTALGQDIAWVRQFGSDNIDYTEGVCADLNRNVFVTGQTYGTFPGQIALGGRDIFIRKYDTGGNELWTRQFGTSSDDFAHSVSADLNGNVYLAGDTFGVLPNQVAHGNVDAFLRKYDAQGIEVWTRQFGTIDYDYLYGVCVDKLGNIYVTGRTSGAFPSQSSQGDGDAFVRKYASDGNEVWTRQFHFGAADVGYSVSVDSNGNVFVAGFVMGNNSSFLRKYDSAGNTLWTKEFVAQNIAVTAGVGVDTDGNAYMTDDAHLRKIDPAGNEVWIRQVTPNPSYVDLPLSVCVDFRSNAYVSGITFGALPGQVNMGGLDAFLKKYDTDGNEQWATQFGSTGHEFTNRVCVDMRGSVYVGGMAGGIIAGQTVPSTGDAFLIKFNEPAISAIDAILALIEKVLALNLQAGIENSLDAKLESALNALLDVNEHNNVAAVNSLSSFINAVQAQSGKFITTTDANSLIQDAQAIILMLSP